MSDVMSFEDVIAGYDLGKDLGKLEVFELLKIAEQEDGPTFCEAWVDAAIERVTEPLARHIAEGKLSRAAQLLVAVLIGDWTKKTKRRGRKPGWRLKGTTAEAERWAAFQVYVARLQFRRQNNRSRLSKGMLKQLIEEKILIARQKYPDAKGMKDDHIKQMLTHGRQLRYDALQARWRVRLLAAD